ncbi:TetR/AcrR family transcriptional regulator [Singulisphaera rosea]
MGRTKTISDAKQRILDTADRLFYAEGTRAVGIDRIIAESGVAKMTLYSHFRSKDDLILAVLLFREVQFTAWFTEAIERNAQAEGGRIGTLFGALKEWFETPTFRGCAFINASVELADPAHPGFAFARQHKQRFRAFLAGFIEESLGRAAAQFAPAVAMLIEGAIVTAVLQGSSEPADVARDAALRLVSESTDR